VEGEITTWTKNYAGLAAPQRFNLGYDNADQLTTAPLQNASTNALIKQYTYGYDSASNRTLETAASTTTTSTPNNVNEITSQSGGVNRTLNYDLNGSVTSDGGTRTFEWDGANRLVAINYTGFTTRSEFTYDGLSRIVQIVEKTGQTINSTRKIVWNGQEMVEFRDATDAVTQRNYSQGQYVGTTAYFYTRDHLGSIREMLTGGGTVVARYDYDPYGRSTTLLGTTPTDFNFTGLYRHSKSNLNFAVLRAYDPDFGRWLSRDPIAEKGGLNLYAYVGNDPVEKVDPLGLFEWRRYVPRGPWNWGRCCNRSQRVEYASVVGVGWVALPQGACIGLSDLNDCEGMTCGGGFYYVHGFNAMVCANGTCGDQPPYNNRRWTGDPATSDPGGMSPSQRGMPAFGDTPPGYHYEPRRR
jgi:RHS repeat-associated protein